MANFTYSKVFTKLASGLLNFTSIDVRVLLVMTNTTADTGEDAEFVASITTLDEYDGAGYARQLVGNETVNEDLVNDRAEFDGDDVVFGSLGVGTRQAQAALVYKHVTNDADSPLLFYVDTGGFPFDGSGTDVTVGWNAEGIAQFKNPA